MPIRTFRQPERLRQEQRDRVTVTVTRRELRKWLRESAEGKAVERLLGGECYVNLSTRCVPFDPLRFTHYEVKFPPSLSSGNYAVPWPSRCCVPNDAKSLRPKKACCYRHQVLFRAATCHAGRSSFRG